MFTRKFLSSVLFVLILAVGLYSRTYIQSDIVITGVIAPSQITANQNNYFPSGFSTATILRISSDASRDITGMQAGSNGSYKCWVNVGAQNIVAKNESASSTAANRLSINADITVGPKQSLCFLYSTTTSRWEVLGGSGSGGGGGTSVLFGATTITAIANGTGINATLGGTILTLNIDSTIPTNVILQAGTPWICNPSSASGTAYSGCGSMSPTLTAYSNGGPIYFKPDINNTGSATLDPDGGGALTAKTIQKLSSGTLTNLSANDLDADGIYLLYYQSTAGVYIRVPLEGSGGGITGTLTSGRITLSSGASTVTDDAGLRWLDDSTYRYIKIGPDTGAGVWIRQLIGSGLLEFKRGDNVTFLTTAFGTIRSQEPSGGIMSEINPAATINSSDVVFFKTAATGDDPALNIRQCQVNTTNNTQTTLCAITITDGRITVIESVITAECESGAGCTAGNGAGYTHTATFRAAAGTATEISETAGAVHEDASVATLTIDTAASGATALIRVTGDTNMNLRWHGTIKITQ